MKKIWAIIKRFFFPPPGSPRWLRLLPFVFLGILTGVAFTGTAYAWEYTNSSPFCGTTCHTMPPEYSAYQRSPHARVQCVECHIGRDVLTTKVSRKAGDARHILLMLTEQYEYPIHTRNMRPARDSCETCHFPEKFSDDSLREIRHYNNDEFNSENSTYLILKTGGGTKREGLGRGIHWHIENEVLYYASDELEQDIPYIRVVNANGSTDEYYDIASNIGPDDIAGLEGLEEMDCIACHNRITHSIPTPEEAVDLALTKGLIAQDLPFFRQQAVNLLANLDATFLDTEAGQTHLATLVDFYAENYPTVYAEKTTDIQAAVGVLQTIYQQIVFPDQKIDWKTHRDNLGHKTDPGCFRCHDGKHLTQDGEAIRLECNLCHSIPVVADQNALVTEIELVEGPEPASHTHTSWMTLHGKAIDSSCASCHPPKDPSILFTKLEGKPPLDGSFCGNEACHGSSWVYTGFDSPALTPILEQQLYILQNTSPYLIPGVPLTYQDTFSQIFDGRCVFCHSGSEPKAGLDLSSYDNIRQNIIAGQPSDSLIYQKQNESLPHFGQMMKDEVEALSTWITTGAPEK